jgi:hypothetical protein
MSTAVLISPELSPRSSKARDICLRPLFALAVRTSAARQAASLAHAGGKEKTCVLVRLE